MLLLCDALREMVTNALSSLQLPGKGGPTLPNVVVGWLPPKRAGAKDDEDFPFIRIIPPEGQDTEDFSLCSVSLLVGAWVEEAEGWRDCVNVIQRIRLSLLALPGRTLAGRYRLAEKEGKFLEWRVYEDQPYPQWFGEITVHFSIPAMVPNLSGEEAILHG